MNPEVAALLEELAADTNKASVTFFPMGIHTHITSDGEGAWNLQVHTTRTSEDDVEEVVSDDKHVSTEELVHRMGVLSFIAEMFMDQMVEESHIGDDAEEFLRQLAGE